MAAQWGDDQLDHGESIVEVHSEASAPRFRREIAVGARDDTHVNALDSPGSHLLDFAFLQGAQQLGLDPQRKLTHFIEHQRSSIGAGEETLACPIGAGECASESRRS